MRSHSAKQAYQHSMAALILELMESNGWRSRGYTFEVALHKVARVKVGSDGAYCKSHSTRAEGSHAQKTFEIPISDDCSVRAFVSTLQALPSMRSCHNIVFTEQQFFTNSISLPSNIDPPFRSHRHSLTTAHHLHALSFKATLIKQV